MYIRLLNLEGLNVRKGLQETGLCNIPLIILEFHQSKVRQRTMFMEFMYDRKCYHATSV